MNLGPLTPEEVEAKLREVAEEEARGLDFTDQFLINMSKLIGVEPTDRFITGGENT